MSNLADKIIKANQEEKRKEDQKYDDIGFPLPKPQTEKAWCEYLTARILYLNPRMYLHENRLWIENVELPEDKNTYYRLAKYPKRITDPECQYVWTRLKEVVPKLNTEWISVLPDVIFNMKTGEFKKEEVWTTTPWEEDE